MPVWVALVRGINLGIHNKVPMPALREALVDDGFTAVQTYVQSGNLVLRSPRRSAAAVGARVEALIAARFGVCVPVCVRAPAELTAVVTANPFPEAAAERPRLLHVSFLTAAPRPEGIANVLDDTVAAKVVRVVGREVYIDYADGVHGSRLTPDFFRRRLGVDGTARNWRTVLALVDLTGG